MDRIDDQEMYNLLNQILEKVKEDEHVDKADFSMVLTVAAVSLARVVEHKYLQIIGEMQDGSDTGEQGKEESSGDAKTA
jgi:hypothetical protein